MPRRRVYVKRAIWKARQKRMEEIEAYREKRECFELEEVFSGWFWKKKSVGWVVNVLTVEGASCSAPMGSIGYLVPREISPVLPTKFSAYRWLAENVQDHNDVSHYLYQRY